MNREVKGYFPEERHASCYGQGGAILISTDGLPTMKSHRKAPLCECTSERVLSECSRPSRKKDNESATSQLMGTSERRLQERLR